MPGLTQVFIATSLDGFIAGADDDLSWLPGVGGDEGGAETASDHGFSAFMAGVGALLMGRRTYDVVAAMGGRWFYGETPVLVATSRGIDEPAAPTVRAISGAPRELLAQAQAVAGERNVYVDGGVLIRSLLDEGLIDELTVSIIPVILGSGIPLFAGAAHRTQLELVEQVAGDGTLVQLRYRPAGRG